MISQVCHYTDILFSTEANSTRVCIEDARIDINNIHRGSVFSGGQLPRCMVLDVVILVRSVIRLCHGGELLDGANDA